MTPGCRRSPTGVWGGARRRRAPAAAVTGGLVALALALAGAGCGGGPRTADLATASSSPTTAGPGAPPCATDELRAVALADVPGATGAAPGVIALSDTGAAPCSLQGYLGVALPDQGGRIVPIEVVHDGLVGRRGLGTGRAPPRPAPVVLTPGTVGAWMGVRWSNWCGRPLSDLAISLVLTGGGELPVAAAGLWAPAPCTSTSAADVLHEGPIQPPSPS